MIDLKGKTVLVTGGSRGIGEAIVRAVAAAGGDVLLHYSKSRVAAEAIQAAIRPATCHLLQADLGEADAPAALWRAATAAARRIDVVVNNAGIFEPVSVEATSEAWSSAWERVLRVNLHAPAELCKLAIPHFRGQQGADAGNAAAPSAKPEAKSADLDDLKAQMQALQKQLETLAQSNRPKDE